MSYLDDLQGLVGAPDGTADEKHRLALVATIQDICQVALWVVYNHYNTIEHVATTMDDKLRKSVNLCASRIDLGATSTLSVPSSHLHMVYEHHCRKHEAMPMTRIELIRYLEGHRCRLVPGAGVSSYVGNMEKVFGPAAGRLAQKQLRVIRFHIADMCKILEVKPEELFPKRISVMIKEEYPHVAV